MFRIKSVQYGVCVFSQTRGEDYDLVKVAHSAQEVVDTWSLENVEIMPVIFYFYWHNIIRRRHRLANSVNECMS